MCDEGWLEAAEAYCACMERGEEWGSNEADKVLMDAVGEGFDNARGTFENFDVDGDRHIQIDELASALEAMGENPGGEITDEIKQMFTEADVNGDEVVDFIEFLGMMGAGNDDDEEEEEEEEEEGKGNAADA